MKVTFYLKSGHVIHEIEADKITTETSPTTGEVLSWHLEGMSPKKEHIFYLLPSEIVAIATKDES